MPLQTAAAHVGRRRRKAIATAVTRSGRLGIRRGRAEDKVVLKDALGEFGNQRLQHDDE